MKAAKIEEKKKLSEESEKELKALEAELQELEQHKNSSEEALNSMSGTMTSLRDQIDSQNSDIIEFLNEAANIKGRMQRYETMQDSSSMPCASFLNASTSSPSEDSSL